MSTIKKAAIAIDTWKLPIFKKRLKEHGYGFTKHPGPTPDTLILKVRTPDLDALGKLVYAMNQEAANSKLN